MPRVVWMVTTLQTPPRKFSWEEISKQYGRARLNPIGNKVPSGFRTYTQTSRNRAYARLLNATGRIAIGTPAVF